MIVTYPLIVSKTVDPNILPGVCKSIEKYIYTHLIDGVVDAANQNIAKQSAKSSMFIALRNIGNKMQLRLENCGVDRTIEDYLVEDWSEDFNEDYIEEGSQKKGVPLNPVKPPSSKPKEPKSTPSSQPMIKSPKKQSNKELYNQGYQKSKGEYDQKQQQIKNEEPKIGKMDSDSMNTTPTWSTVTDQQGNTKAIGVKVVPFIIDNEESLVSLMTSDRYRSKLSKNVHVQARKVLRYMHGIANATWKRTVGFLFSWTGFVDKDLVKGTVTKNWKNDIILQNTFFKNNMFVLLNKMDLKDDFTSNPGGVKKLFSLGWTSFIVADDVNKTVTFCLQEFRGMCSIVNYAFLYADGRSQSQVYQDISDVRRNSGPLGRMKRSRKTMITDNLAQQKLDKYSQEVMMSESIINESFLPDIAKKIKETPKSLVSDFKSIQSAFKRKDYKKVSQISKKINPGNKNIDANKAIDKAIVANPEFKKNYILAHRVFKNSLPQLDESILKLGAGMLAAIGTLNKKKGYNFKNDLKKVVMDTRSRTKTLEEDSDEFADDLKVAFLFSVIGLFLLGSSITLFLYYLSMAIPIVGGALSVYWPIIVLTTVCLGVIKFWGGVSKGDKDDD